MSRTKANNIGTFLWMGLSDGNARSVPEFNQPDLLDAIVKGFYGDEGYINAIDNPETNVPAIESVYTLNGMKIHSHPHPHGIYIQGGKAIVIK